MAQSRFEQTNSLRVLAGAEFETLADYFGQGALVVHYANDLTGKLQVHRLKDAYDNVIARPEAPEHQLCMSTDSNRSEEGYLFPKRTCIEFRSGPEGKMTEELLHLIESYSTWLTKQKNDLRRTQFVDYANPNRREAMTLHYLKLSDFVTYYNSLKKTTNKLIITLPHVVFDPRNSGPDFSFHFPNDTEWALELGYEDLKPRLDPVFFAQYNLSLPIGCVFSPKVKSAFPITYQFALIEQEKEIAADFNESRPHPKLRAYEQQIFTLAVQLADDFFNQQQVPSCAIGALDFLRGVAYELAMISTSQKFLIELFHDEALWITEQHQKAVLAKGDKTKTITAKDVYEIAESLANTLRKSLFPYFMKSTLAEFFKHLHPYEQQLLRAIPKQQIKAYCQKAINLANGGKGNAQEHSTMFLLHHDSFMELFDDFYEQTFKSTSVPPGEVPADPIGHATTRFIPITNIGTQSAPVQAVVVELRSPAQGVQKHEDMRRLCSSFNATHKAILTDFYAYKKQSDAALDMLSRGIKDKAPVHLAKVQPKVTPTPIARRATQPQEQSWYSSLKGYVSTLWQSTPKPSQQQPATSSVTAPANEADTQEQSKRIRLAVKKRERTHEEPQEKRRKQSHFKSNGTTADMEIDHEETGGEPSPNTPGFFTRKREKPKHISGSERMRLTK